VEVRTYLVERYLPGTSGAELVAAAERAASVSRKMQDDGVPVRYLGSTHLAGEEACLCRFEAPSAALVAEANERAGFPFARIIASEELPAGRSAT
jgi:uncharacterized protein DUF4242